MHPGSTKMYRTIKENYWWFGMKKDIAKFVFRCLVCQQVKAEHRKPLGTLQPLPILKWKWEHITMDFIVGLPRTQIDYNAIWVIMDRLTKLAHFPAIHNNFFLDRLAKLYINEIVKLHGVLVSIVSDWDLDLNLDFGLNFKRLQVLLYILVLLVLQTDGQSERTIQTLEDILRACVLEFKDSWVDHLSLVKFAYNNSYHASIGMAPYPVWEEVQNTTLLGQSW